MLMKHCMECSPIQLLSLTTFIFAQPPACDLQRELSCVNLQHSAGHQMPTHTAELTTTVLMLVPALELDRTRRSVTCRSAHIAMDSDLEHQRV